MSPCPTLRGFQQTSAAAGDGVSATREVKCLSCAHSFIPSHEGEVSLHKRAAHSFLTQCHKTRERAAYALTTCARATHQVYNALPFSSNSLNHLNLTHFLFTLPTTSPPPLQEKDEDNNEDEEIEDKRVKMNLEMEMKKKRNIFVRQKDEHVLTPCI